MLSHTANLAFKMDLAEHVVDLGAQMNVWNCCRDQYSCLSRIKTEYGGFRGSSFPLRMVHDCMIYKFVCQSI